MISIATLFSPPSGIIKSANRIDGSTNRKCIGRTVSRYCLITVSTVLPLSFYIAAKAADETDIVGGMNIEFDIKQLP